MTRQTKKIEKIKCNPQWLEKYSLVTARREVKNKKTNTLILIFVQILRQVQIRYADLSKTTKIT